MVLIINDNIYELVESQYADYIEYIHPILSPEHLILKSDFQGILTGGILHIRYKTIQINGKYYIPKLVKHGNIF